MSERISQKEINDLMEICKIGLSKEDILLFRNNLSKLISYLDQINKINVDNVEPFVYANNSCTALADDIPERPINRSELFVNAPDTVGAFLKVPKVIDNK